MNNNGQNNYTVVIADSVSERCDEALQGRGVTVVRMVGVPRNQLLAALPGAHAMIVRSAITVDAGMIEVMENMRVIGRAGAGVDNIDVAAATGKGILVMNTPGGNTISAAEHTIAMMMAMLRKIPGASASLARGEWNRKAFAGFELFGKTVGVAGLGRIGKEVAARLRSFQVELLGFDPVLGDEAIRELGIAAVTFDELLERSDILTLHVPLTDETRGAIGAGELARMKSGSFIVNCARGGIVDESALVEAINTGHIAGAAIDVFEQEPPSFPHSLFDHPSVVVTPHIAASTTEAQVRVAVAIAEQIADYLQGHRTYGVVNTLA